MLCDHYTREYFILKIKNTIKITLVDRSLLNLIEETFVCVCVCVCVCAVVESEEVNLLRLAVQDLENQIEEQKFKIQSTPMPLLRVSC